MNIVFGAASVAELEFQGGMVYHFTRVDFFIKIADGYGKKGDE